MTIGKRSTDLWEKAKALSRRFPLALCHLVMFTIFILILIQTGWEWPDEKMIFFGMLYLPTAALMALSFHLLNEEVRHKKRGDVVEAIVLIGWLAFCGYLTNCYEYLEMADTYLPVACVCSIIVSIFTLSFYYQKNDVPFWRFCLKLLVGAFIAYMVSLFLMGGIALLFVSFNQLFGWEIPDKAFASAATICIVFIGSILFLLRIPYGDEKRDVTIPQLSKFYKGVVYYLFMPLLLCYMLTLYLYAFSILIRWELPNGWVSWLTTVLMFGMLAVVFMLYPQQFSPVSHDLERKTFRWLPALVIPLLVLMSVGIWRRISDYGITIDRLYILLFNVWCYVVCLVLCIQKSRRVWWIPISFCALFFLASIGPWSFTAITKRVMLKELEEALRVSGRDLPMNNQQYKAWAGSLPEDKQFLNDRLDYLSRNYGSGIRSHLVVDTVWISQHIWSEAENAEVITDRPYDIEVLGLLKEHPLSIPSGYNELYYFEMEDVDAVEFQGDSLSFSILDYHVQMPCQAFVASMDETNQRFVIQQDSALIIGNDVFYDREREALRLNGILLKKK
ncbi:MAG: DUF4153 domain-containing protein [Bacteroidales bacterium]|nr:DUF4153 domain-containing protein [Bacteroidales bacterium]